jgi:hypothetical protein
VRSAHVTFVSLTFNDSRHSIVVAQIAPLPKCSSQLQTSPRKLLKTNTGKVLQTRSQGGLATPNASPNRATSPSPLQPQQQQPYAASLAPQRPQFNMIPPILSTPSISQAQFEFGKIHHQSQQLLSQVNFLFFLQNNCSLSHPLNGCDVK